MPSDDGQPKKPNKVVDWDRVQGRAKTAASIVTLFAFLLVVGGVGGYVVSQFNKKPTETKNPTVQNLTPEDIAKLSELGANLGTSGQILNIGANALFRGKADVTGDLTIGGKLNANGPVTLSQLNITGNTAATGLNVGSNLAVSGVGTFEKSLVVKGLLSAGNLNVSGSSSVNSLNASSISVRTISISGPLTIAHLATQGPTPFISAGAVGGGGTVNINGNDTAGTVNINTGGGPSANVTLATITFRGGYSGTTHVQLTPKSAAGATANAYVNTTSNNFRILAATPPAGQTLSFDYLVTQ